jgi:outer membrane protein OmpA-like peptidoglycan-associated protein
MKKIIIMIAILSLGITSYSKGFQLNLGYDVWRSVSDVPGSEGSESMNQGYTIGGEYMLDYNDRFHYGLGAEYRSHLKNSDFTLNESVPLYLVGKYDVFNHQLYLVGRVGYNITSNVIGGSTGGGHYVAAGIGKEVGLIDIEVLYENMGYNFKGDDTDGTHSSVGLKFGFKLGDIYDAITKSREAAPEPEVKPTPVEEKPKVIYKDRIVKVYVVRGGSSKFALDQASLSKDEKIQLNNMKKNGTFDNAKEVKIIGHTDTSGPEDYNMKLSIRRAQAVARELNLPKDVKVTITGKGETESLEGSPALDRRVEIEVIK